MKIRNEWMTNNQYFGEDYQNDLLLENAKQRFNLQLNSLEGKNGKIDGIDERFIVQNHANTLNKYNGEEYIHCNETSNIHRGSVVDYENKKWLVTSDILNNQAYKSGIIQKCNQTLNWKSLSIPTITYSYPVVKLSKNGSSLDENKYISLPIGQIKIKLQYDSITSNIKYKQRFIINSQVYEVIEFDDATDVVDLIGVLNLTLQITTANDLDDFINKIADNSHLYQTGGDTRLW